MRKSHCPAHVHKLFPGGRPAHKESLPLTVLHRHKMTYRLFTLIKQLIYASVVYTLRKRIIVLFIASNCRRTKMKMCYNVGFNFTSN